MQERGKGLEWVILIYAVLIVILLCEGLSYWVGYHRFSKIQEKKTIWSSQLSGIKKKVAQVEQLDAEINLLNSKKTAVESLFGGRLRYPKLMAEFYRTIPKDVWVSDLTIKEKGDNSFEIIALSNAVSTDGIADWLVSLESKPNRYTQIKLSTIDARKGSDGDSVESFGFSISLVYKAT